MDCRKEVRGLIHDRISEAVIKMDDEESRKEHREKLSELVNLSYEYGRRHDRSAKEDLIRSILSGGYD